MWPDLCKRNIRKQRNVDKEKHVTFRLNTNVWKLSGMLTKLLDTLALELRVFLWRRFACYRLRLRKPRHNIYCSEFADRFDSITAALWSLCCPKTCDRTWEHIVFTSSSASFALCVVPPHTFMMNNVSIIYQECTPSNTLYIYLNYVYICLFACSIFIYLSYTESSQEDTCKQ